ncbi:hypothetical protein PVAP13_1NG074100 [Panicum virgatum]|uniref:Uncharacterized protein n=1 Tax=Panicum virgatum TaxID=38727 RepID=A0A8T0X077_PANVG|nr:hypothetical protein PVAP13_1NG074100 [Panicum virgatum]
MESIYGASVAEHNGMPISLVPPHLPPSPAPPGFVSNQTQSPENAAAALGSAIREETPEETLSRITNGVFRSHESTTTSGGGNYSPPQEDFPLFRRHGCQDMAPRGHISWCTFCLTNYFVSFDHVRNYWNSMSITKHVGVWFY